MPDALTRRGPEGNQGIGEEVVAVAVGSVEVEGGRSRGDEDQSPLLIHTHTRPTVGGSRVFPRLLRPGFVTRFSRMGNRVKRPAKLAGPDIVGAHVSRRRRQALTHDAALNQEIPVDHTGRPGPDPESLGRPPQAQPEIDPPGVAEAWNQPAAARVQRVEVRSLGGEDAPFPFIPPPDETPAAALGTGEFTGQFDAPEQLAGGRLQREDPQRRRHGIENIADDNGVARHLRVFGGVARVVCPGQLQPLHVSPVDLGQSRIADALGIASIHPPVLVPDFGDTPFLSRGESRKRQDERRERPESPPPVQWCAAAADRYETRTRHLPVPSPEGLTAIEAPPAGSRSLEYSSGTM